MKIAIIGVGSFVFGPSALWDAIVEHRLAGAELALVDLAADVLSATAAAARRLADDSGVALVITEHTELSGALEGADFVVCSAARELFKRFQTDCRVIDAVYPKHLITEFGGVVGISYTLRQIELIRNLCADMRRLCPDAWLLNMSNPLPRVCQAAHQLGVKTAGFCMASLSAYGWISRMTTAAPLAWPFTPLIDQLTLDAAGVNHLTFATSIRNQDGSDLLSDLREKVQNGNSAGWPISEALLAETGYLPMPGDNHIADFLPPTPSYAGRHQPGHGTPAERAQRIALLRAIAAGEASFTSLLDHRSWEKPIAFIAGLRGESMQFCALNLVNEGQLPDLPRGVFVEAPAGIEAGKVITAPMRLPSEILPLIKATAEQNNRITRAGLHHDHATLRQAIELDPTIDDPAAGWAAMQQCLAAHADVLPGWQ